MSSARSRPLGLRTRLTLWSSLVFAASLAAGFAWVHHGLRGVLEARNDAFLERKAAELLGGLAEPHPEGRAELDAEIGREVSAYQAEGLVIIVREAGRTAIVPRTPPALHLAARSVAPGAPRTIDLGGSAGLYRVLQVETDRGPLTLELGISLAETSSTLAAFDRRVAGGAVVFLVLAVAGGRFLSRQALRPVAESVRTARRLAPENLSERLPRTGADDELDELAATINGLLDRLAAFHAQVIRFTADASHELRSPLGTMRAAIEVALQQPRTPDAYRAILASLGEQCEQITALVNGLLLLARADAGEIVLQRHAVDLADLARDVAEVFEPLAEERGIRLSARAPIPTAVAGDPARLRQLVTNLLENAIRFTNPGGSVTVAIERVGDRVRLRVADTGIGIPADHLPFIFDRFYQADPARSSSGCGLGLSICRWIVDAHGGSIETASRLGQGTEFTVTLPLSPAQPVAAEPAPTIGETEV